ncbi:YkgJ family cysteine cluster protein [Marinagarivorans algicola]|uniref:YkgJ family cysteine cluster protein n=1 Tax=Marinagarivorans algicola TaxID=1513270 RepID=UPI00314051D7
MALFIIILLSNAAYNRNHLVGYHRPKCQYNYEIKQLKACNQCGKCCLKYGQGALAATANDIEMWALFNPDIMQYVQNGKIWMDPKTGEQLQRCPFLVLEEESQKYTCSIYHDRPEDCRHYPTHIIEMVRDECEMIELVDLEAPKKAQIQLDSLMKDSRPAYAKA